MKILKSGEESVIIVGAHGEIIELCELLGRKVIGVVHGRNPVDLPGYPTLGYDRDAERLQREHNDASIVVTPDKPAKRRHLAETFIRAGFSLADLIHPGTTISRSSHIDTGAVIQAGVNISTETNIGLCVKLNFCANVMHDCEIGDYVTIAPNAVILGRAIISDDCYVGAGAIILPGIKVGNQVTVGAGAVVTVDVAGGKTVVGNPARELQH